MIIQKSQVVTRENLVPEEGVKSTLTVINTMAKAKTADRMEIWGVT